MLINDGLFCEEFLHRIPRNADLFLNTEAPDLSAADESVCCIASNGQYLHQIIDCEYQRQILKGYLLTNPLRGARRQSAIHICALGRFLCEPSPKIIIRKNFSYHILLLFM